MRFLPSRSIFIFLLVSPMMDVAMSNILLDIRPKFIKSSGVLSDMKMLTIPKGSGGPTMALSPGGKYLAVTGGKSKLLVIFDVEKENIIKRISRKEIKITGNNLLFSPDGRYLVAGRWSGGKDRIPSPMLVLIDGNNFNVIGEVADGCCYKNILSYAFSPDSKNLILSSAGKNRFRTMGLFDTETWKIRLPEKNELGAEAIEFTADGKYIIDLYQSPDEPESASAGNGKKKTFKLRSYHAALRVRDANNLKLIKTIENYTGGASVFHDDFAVHPNSYQVSTVRGKFLPVSERMAGDDGFMNMIRIRNIWKDKQDAAWEILRSGTQYLNYTRDSKYLIKIGRDQEKNVDQVFVYSANDGKLLEHIEILATPFALGGTMSPDGGTVALYWANRIFVWRINAMPSEVE